MNSLPSLAERLRCGTAGRDPSEQAAVELLTADKTDDVHPGWLDIDEFTDLCVLDDGHTSATIAWDRARAWFDSTNSDNWAFSIDFGFLDFAIALGENRFGLDDMDERRNLLVTALTRAIGHRVQGSITQSVD
ncbi:hypothetical protein ACWDOR_18910 [Streptosporangium canum]|uniref:hypothetical protein n=1 Tax=Streptosporangium canum TaxID=324952 RepID=UPI0036CF227C